MIYIDRMLGCQDQNVYSETKKLKVLCTNTSPKCIFSCIKFPAITSEAEAKNYLFNIKVFVLQFCVVLAICGMVGGCLIVTNTEYGNQSTELDSVWLWFSVMQVISSTFALLFLLNFGMYVNKIPEMASFQIINKFIIIKLGILFTEFQPVVVGIFTNLDLIASTSKYSKDEITLYTNSLLLCSEMVIMSFLLILIFPVSDYKKSSDTSSSIASESEYLKLNS